MDLDLDELQFVALELPLQVLHFVGPPAFSQEPCRHYNFPLISRDLACWAAALPEVAFFSTSTMRFS